MRGANLISISMVFVFLFLVTPANADLVGPSVPGIGTALILTLAIEISIGLLWVHKTAGLRKVSLTKVFATILVANLNDFGQEILRTSVVG